MDIDQLLERWGKRLREENIGISFPEQSPFYNLWECRIRYTRVLLIPNYWPDREAQRLNELIAQLPSRLSNPIFARYYHGLTQQQAARLCQCSRNALNRRLAKAKELLEEQL